MAVLALCSPEPFPLSQSRFLVSPVDLRGAFNLLYDFAMWAVTSDRKLGHFKQPNGRSHRSGVWKSKIVVLARRSLLEALGEKPLPVCVACRGGWQSSAIVACRRSLGSVPSRSLLPVSVFSPSLLF